MSERRKATGTRRRITRVFIANRGEIARRIGLTVRRLGLESATVYAGDTPPAYLADAVDHFVKISEDTTASYLDGAAMIAAAVEAGCDALHPGFGFLSENAAFAQKTLDAGMIWIGPPPKAIEVMASKARARDAAVEAAVPVIEGLSDFPVPEDETGNFGTLESFCERIGYPVLLKAALGGGGKGMRPVFSREDLRSAALRAKSEALGSFGDDALICEKFLTDPRHVEVQILADGFGRAVAIGDRDCSVQRRHQKIVEEAPAPELGPETRAAMHAAACHLATRVGYESAGTVEFLVDWSPDARKSNEQTFYFLEMNTRLQVEHPVTEEVFGMDLVEWQIRVAQGEPLPEEFENRAPRGHSVEVRVYAEDPENGYLPSPGTVAAFVPATGPGIRWEIGLAPLDEITGAYDPMVAKLVATAETREKALDRLALALESTFFAGPPSNLRLLAKIARHEPFRASPVSTHYLERYGDELLQALADARESRHAQGDSLMEHLRAGRIGGGVSHADRATPASLTERAFGGVARSGPESENQKTRPRTETIQVASRGAGSKRRDVRYGLGWAREDDTSRPFWYAVLTTATGRDYWIQTAGEVFHAEKANHASRGTETGEVSGELSAPVPGKVVAVRVAPGDEVEKNAPVAILESMKMEFEVRAPRQGTIGTVDVAPGDQVAAGQALATFATETQ